MTGKTRPTYGNPWLLLRAQLITICSAQVLWKLLLPLSVEPRSSEAVSGYLGSSSHQPSAQPLGTDYESLPEAELKAMLEKKCCPLCLTAQPCPLQGNRHFPKPKAAIYKALWNISLLLLGL